MSVLIKGMEMPSSCNFCVMLDEDDKNFCYAEMREVTDRYGERPEWCPLAEVNENAVLVTGGEKYCEREICITNEYNGVSCDECIVAQNYNLEDDDSPCQNCEVGE